MTFFDYLMAQSKSLRRVLFFFLIFGIVTLVSAVSIFKIDIYSYFKTETDPTGQNALIFVLITAVIGVALSIYAKGTDITVSSPEQFFGNSQVEELVKDAIDKQLGVSDMQLSETVTSQIDAIVSRLTFDEILNRFTEVERIEHIEISKLKSLNSEFDAIRSNIIEQKAIIKRSSNINLLLGFVITSSAIGVLFVTLNQRPINFEWREGSFLMLILPRIALSILVQIFAFFFLKLYKSNFDDIKYYNNELTNVNTKIAALKSAVLFKNKSIDYVIRELVDTERNYILKKGESTIEIQRDIIREKGDKRLIQALTKLIPTFKGK